MEFRDTHRNTHRTQSGPGLADGSNQSMEIVMYVRANCPDQRNPTGNIPL
jgi:hypothetical protein